MAVARSLSLLVKFAGIDKLTGKMRSIGSASKKTGSDIAGTRREVDRLQKAQARIAAFKGLESKLRDEAKAIADTRDKLAKLRSEKEKADGSTKALTRSIGAAERKEKQLVDRHEAHGRELQDLSRRLSEAGIDVADLTRHEERLAHETRDATNRLREQRSELERQGQRRARLEKIDNAGGKLRGAGVGMMASGAAAGAPLIASAGTWRGFQGAMTDIAQKADLTQNETRLMAQDILRIGPAVGQLPTDLQAAVDALAGLGMDPRQAMIALPDLGRASTAYRAQMDDLAAATFASVDNLKVPVDQTGKALDVMALAGKRGAFEMKDMARHFPALTAASQALGQKGVPAVADLSAALQIARKGAGDADTAGNNILNLLNKINAKDTIDNFAKLGIDLPKAMRKAYAEGKTPIEAIAELTDKALGGNLERLPYLFGDMQVQAALRPLLQNMDEYRSIRADALAAQGTVATDFAQRMLDSEAKAALFDARMQSVAVKIGSVVGPKIDWLKDRVGALAENFLDWSEKHPALANGLITVVGAAAAALVVFGGLALAIGTIMGPVARGAMMLWRLGGVFRFLLSPIQLVVRGLMIAIGAIAAFVGLPAWLVGAIAVGLVAAGVLIWKNWDKIKAAFWTGIEWLKGLWNGFWNIGKYIVGGIISGIGSMFGALKNKIVGLGKNAVGWFKGVLGIHSPSRVFMGLGGHLTQGLTIGVDRGSREPLARMKRLAGQMSAALAIGAAGTAPAAAGPSSGASGAPASVHHHSWNLNVTLKGDGDLRQQARELFEELQRLQRVAEASSFRDEEDGD